MTALTERLSRALGAIDKDACKLAGAQVMEAKKRMGIIHFSRHHSGFLFQGSRE
jgi:hypothetical protein